MIILEDVDFQWKQKDIDKVIKLWNQNINLRVISAAIKRDTDETFLLLLHLSRKRQIKRRDNGIFGKVN
jgi:hypothetical protein